MKIVIAWWDLSESSQTVESLRLHLQSEGVETWQMVAGLKSKYWFSDVENQLWGAILLWRSREHMEQPLPPNHASELIGYPPTKRIVLSVEAFVDGVSQLPY